MPGDYTAVWWRLLPNIEDLGFLTSEGLPTERYRDYLDASRSRQVLGKAVYDAYSDIFTITKNPTKVDRAKIAGKFKSSFNLSDLQAERNANTFLALAELSDFTQLENAEKASFQIAPRPEPTPAPLAAAETNGGRIIGLKYDIAIHLPATKDIEVYNAIFKSLREHLVD